MCAVFPPDEFAHAIRIRLGGHFVGERNANFEGNANALHEVPIRPQGAHPKAVF